MSAGATGLDDGWTNEEGWFDMVGAGAGRDRPPDAAGDGDGAAARADADGSLSAGVSRPGAGLTGEDDSAGEDD